MIVNNEIISIKDLIVANSDCEQVYLFGSYAYGTPREDEDLSVRSDYDFYVVLNDNAKNPLLVMEDIEVALAHMRLNLIQQNERLGLTTKPMLVDFIGGYRSTFEERNKFLTIEHTIAEKGVLLYDKYDPDNAMVYHRAV
jgi:predicted nucleotidyltransferase